MRDYRNLKAIKLKGNEEQETGKFSFSPVDRALCFPCQGPMFNPCLGELRSKKKKKAIVHPSFLHTANQNSEEKSMPKKEKSKFMKLT